MFLKEKKKKNKKMTDQYEDIINLPHHVSDRHPRMSMEDRAAQFAPFAALTGHADAIRQTARSVAESYEKEENPEYGSSPRQTD